MLFAVLIFILHETGQITRFINPNYLYFSQIASVLFLFLFFIQVPRIFAPIDHDHTQCGPWGCNHESGEGFSLSTVLAYGLISLPLITGFLLPYKDFGAMEAVKRGVSYATHHDHGHIEDHQLCNEKIDHKISDIIQLPALNLENNNFGSYMTAITMYPQSFVGKTIELEGFIVEDDFHSTIQTVISRFIVTHCVADAHAVGLIIEHGDKLGIQQNTWIHLKGKLNIKEDGESFIPIIQVESWKEIDPPIEPYIYF